MPNRYAIVNDNGDVENVIVWDGKSRYEPPAKTQLIVASDSAGPGDKYDHNTGTFIRAVVPDVAKQ